jgi:hypothetical protein
MVPTISMFGYVVLGVAVAIEAYLWLGLPGVIGWLSGLLAFLHLKYWGGTFPGDDDDVTSHPRS